MEDDRIRQEPQHGYGMPSGNPVIFDNPDFAVSTPVYASAPSPMKRNAPSTGLILGLVAIIALFLTLVFGIASCSSAMNTMMGSMGMVDSSSAVHDSTPKIGVITIDGTIQYDGTSNSPGGLRSLLDQAENRDDIVAVVLRVNSGGGSATAGEEMSQCVADFKKPIVVSSASTNASAAYEISSQADYIFTAKTTSIGAIGVIMQITDLSGLYDMLGINIESITSTDSKEATYGNRPLTEEERAWYQNSVDQINNDFIEAVSKGRDMPIEDVRLLANGMSYTGKEAVENGLADEIGYFNDAVRYTSELAGYNQELPTTSLTLSSSSSLDALLNVLGSVNGDSYDDVINDLARSIKNEDGVSY